MRIRPYLVHLSWIFILSGICPTQAAVRSLLGAQKSLSVTVYTNDLALIRDVRNVLLPLGRGELQVRDVASHIMPETVCGRSLDSPNSFKVLEQTYRYDLMNPSKLLNKYVGKRIKIINWNKYQDRKEVVDAILLSNNQGQVYRIHNEIFLGYPGLKVLPKLPEGLVTRPTLTWLYENKKEGSQSLEVSYLTSEMSWKTDYVLSLQGKGPLSSLSGWVTIQNRSGVDFRDARLKLVAGQVHRAEKSPQKRVYAATASKKEKVSQFQTTPFSEYHVYDLRTRTDILDQEAKQIALLQASGLQIKKEFLVQGSRNFFTRRYRPMKANEPVRVYMRFRNSKENHLGVPLPAGTVRVYEEDRDGTMEFIGEAKIGHTPENEEVELPVGEAFDLMARRVQSDYKQLSAGLYETEWEITLRNHKKTETDVGVVEPLIGNWKILNASHSYKKIDAFTIRFDVHVPAGGENKVRYRVKVGL